MATEIDAFKSRSGGGATVEVIANCACGAYLYWRDEVVAPQWEYPEHWYCKARCGQEYHLNPNGTLYPIHGDRSDF